MKKLFAILLIILIIWLQYRIWIGANSRQKLAQINQEIELQKKQHQVLKQINETMKRENILLRSDPDILEEKAREKMGLVKKEEVFYRIIIEPKESNQAKDNN